MLGEDPPSSDEAPLPPLSLGFVNRSGCPAGTRQSWLRQKGVGATHALPAEPATHGSANRPLLHPATDCLATAISPAETPARRQRSSHREANGMLQSLNYLTHNWYISEDACLFSLHGVTYRVHRTKLPSIQAEQASAA